MGKTGRAGDARIVVPSRALRTAPATGSRRALAGAGLAAVLAWTGAAVAGEGFGPQDYTRTGGAANVFQTAFALCGPERSFRLRVENGPDGQVRVRTVTVALNGASVVMPADLERQLVVERPVAVRVQNTLGVTLDGPRRGTVRVTVSAEGACAHAVTIDSPAPGAGVPAGPLVVRGRVTGPGEMGVTVNGRVAAVRDDTFTALVPVTPDVTELVAVATTVDGQPVERRQPLGVEAGGPAPAVQVVASPLRGAAPLPVRFVLLSEAPLAAVELDADGDGAVDAAGPGSEGLGFTFAQPGVYLARAFGTDLQGARHEARALVEVLDRAALDQVIQARMAVLRDALGRGDVESALTAFALGSRDGFRAQLEALHGVGALGEVAADLGVVRLAAVREGLVEGDLRAMRDGQVVSFAVLFVVDDDGVWRLWRW